MKLSIKSKQPRKMRKAFYEAPLHARQAFLHAHLSKELRKQLRKRAVRVAKGDTVQVMKGRFKKIIGKVVQADVRRGMVFVEGVVARRARGEKDVFVPLRPSNVIVTALAERKPKKKKVVQPQPQQARQEQAPVQPPSQKLEKLPAETIVQKSTDIGDYS